MPPRRHRAGPFRPRGCNAPAPADLGADGHRAMSSHRPVQGRPVCWLDGKDLRWRLDRFPPLTKQVILSVKAGQATVAHLRDLCGVVDREKA
jgi:hypothetical protein